MKSKMFGEVGGNSAFEKAAAGLLGKGLVEEIQSTAKSGPNPTFYPLTGKAQDLLEIVKAKVFPVQTD